MGVSPSKIHASPTMSRAFFEPNEAGIHARDRGLAAAARGPRGREKILNFGCARSPLWYTVSERTVTMERRLGLIIAAAIFAGFVVANVVILFI